MSFSKVSFCFVIVAALCQLSIAADHSNFKTCEQSGFCRRNRNLNVDTNKWTVVSDTIQSHATSLSFHIKNTDKGLEYQATLTGLLDGQSFRFTVNDPLSIRKRFDASNLVLTPNLKLSPLTVRDGQEITVEVPDNVHKSKNKIVISKEPFRMDVYSGNDLVMVVNERNMFNFEKARAKDDADNSCTDGCWEESFKGSTDSKPHGAMSVGVDVTFVNFEHVYGLPAHADSLSLRNTKGTMDPYRLYNVDIFEYELESPMSLYGAYPLMLAHNTKPKTVGFFWLNPSETWIDIESSNSGGILGGIVGNGEVSKQTHWFSETGTVDMFFLLGPSTFDVMSQNGDLFGKTALPPIYSLGHHQCRWNYYSVEEVMDVDKKADIYEIPMDAIWLDIEYTDGRSKKYFTWDPIQFKEHEMMIRNLTSKGRRLIAIIDPHIKKESGYSIYDEATSLGYFTKDAKEDKDYDGWCWPGSSCWADFVDPDVRDWWADKFNPKVFPGFEGGIVDIWNDMNEPSVFSGPEITAPRDMRHHNGIEHRDIHNMYGYLMTMSTHKGLVKHRPNLRPFILTRSFFAGSQRTSAVWTGDNMCKWDHLKASIPMLLSHSLTGITFIGADIPGFFYDPESEEIVLRWYQAAIFYPFFRAHAHVDTKRREPWIFSKDTLDGIRNAIQVRYSYMPYIYQLFYENEKTGVAPMRPLWVEFPTDKNTLGVDHVFMMGSALLNAPILDKGVQNLDVYLPAGAHWLDMRTLTIHEGGKTIQIPVDHQSVPIFQRAGTIVPRRIRHRRALVLSVEDPISVDIFADAGGLATGDLYLDDGHSYNYRNSNKFIKGTFTLKDKRFTYSFTEGAKDANSAWLERVTIYNVPSKPNKIYSGDGKQQIGFKYDSNSKVLVVRKVGCTFGVECSFKIL